MKQTTSQKKASLEEIALNARQIGDAHDIFSGEMLRREEITRYIEHSGPHGSSYEMNKCHIFESGTGGRLYCVSFICDFQKQFEVELNKGYDELAEINKKDYTQKGLDENDVKILLDHTEESRKNLRNRVFDFFVLGSRSHRGTLCDTDLNRHYYYVESGSEGIFIAEENNLREQTSLRDLMRSSAISAQLSAGLNVVEPEYQRRINLFLDEKISVESRLVDTIRIARAYAQND